MFSNNHLYLCQIKIYVMNIRKLNRIIHRDLGYVFFAASIIYGLSGIALNHIKDWNPNYIVTSETYEVQFENPSEVSTVEIKRFLESIGEQGNYKKHYTAGDNSVKVFIKNGSVFINTLNKEAYLEKLERRPIFHQFNFLHYNHSRRLWTWFADAYAISLILLAISGLFMIKGRKGIKGRGAVLTAVGIAIPLILFLLYA